MYVAPFLVGVGAVCIALVVLAILIWCVLLWHDSNCRRRDEEARRERIVEEHQQVSWDASLHGPTRASQQWPPSRW